MSREKFEYEAGKALNLPTNIIELARKGDGYDHAFDSMNIMQPLNGWWHWWKAGAASMQSELDQLATECAERKSAAKKVIKMNRQHAKDKHGNSDIAESWACVKVLRQVNTPATDRFLAEQRALGVDNCAAVIQQQVWDEREGDGIVAALDAMEIYAAQLRNEVKV